MFKFRRPVKRQLTLLLSLLSMVLLVGIAACGQPSATDVNTPDATGTMPTEFRIGYQLTTGSDRLLKSLGLLEEKFPDISITWTSFDSGPAVNDALAAGSVDAGLVGSVPVSVGIAKDLPYQVYFILNVIGDSEGLVASKDSGISSIEDLPGKTIAVPFGSTSHFSLMSAIEQAGIDASAVQILDMQPQDLLAAWQVGDIDGAYVWTPTLTLMLDEGGEVVVTSRELAEDGIVTADIGVVNKAFAAQYPDFLSSYVETLDAAVRLYQEDPQAASEAMSVEIALSPEESLETMEGLVWLTAEEQSSDKYLGTPDAPGDLSQILKNSADFLVEQGQLDKAPDLKAYESALYNSAIATVEN